MTRALLQTAEIASLAAIAASAHVYVARRRAPLTEALEALAGASMRAVLAIADVVAGLLYAAFAFAVVPVDGASLVSPAELETAFDTVAVFALLVASVMVVTHVVAHRVAQNLEPWPPRSEAEAL